MPEPKRLGDYSPQFIKSEFELINRIRSEREFEALGLPSGFKPANDVVSELALVRQALAEKEAAAPVVEERGALGEFAAGFGRGALGVVATPAYLTEVAGEAVGWEGLEKVGAAGAEAVEKYIEESPKLRRTESISRNILKSPELWKDPRWYASIVGEGLPTILSMLVPGMAAARTARMAGLGVKGIKAARMAGGFGAGMGLEAGGAAADIKQYEKATGKEVPISTKLQSVLGTGIVAGSLEYVPIFAIFGKAGAKKLVGRVLSGMALEGTTEGAQGLIANAFAKAGYDADRNMIDGVVESIVGGVLLGGGMGAVSRATNFKERVDETNPDEVSDILEQVEKETRVAPEKPVELTEAEKRQAVIDREFAARRTPEERQAEIEAAMPATPMTTISEETTKLAEEGIVPAEVIEPIPEEIVPEEIPLAPEAMPAPLRAMGMRPVPTEPIVEKPVVEEKVVEPEVPKIEIPTLTDTTQAITFGEKATPEQITELKRLRKESEARYYELVEADKLDEAGKEALKAQLYREAFEVKEKPKELVEPKPEAVKLAVKFEGMQEQAGKPSFPIVTESDTKSTVQYDPEKHEITNIAEYEEALARPLMPEAVEKEKIEEAPLAISEEAEADLVELNYTKDDISRMTPEDALDILESRLKKEPKEPVVAKPQPPRLPTKAVSMAVEPTIKPPPIPEVAPKAEKKEEHGFAWIKGKQKPILSARKITSGKNKGKYEVVLTKGRDEEGDIVPGAKKIVTEKHIITMPEEKIEVAPIEEAKSRIKASTTEILKGERGSFSIKTKEGAATFEDFSIVGKDFINRGFDTFTKFTEQMKTTFGEVWESVKHFAKEIYTRAKAILTEERGEITIREEVPKIEKPIEAEPKVKKQFMEEAFKVLGIKPKLKPGEPLPKRARSVGLAYQDISEEAKRLEVEMGLEYPKVTRTHAELREQADRIMGDQEQLIKTMEKEKNFTEAEGLVVRRAAATGLESLMKVVATKDIKKANEIHKEFKEGVGKQVQDLHSEFGRNLESLKEVVSPESVAKAFAGLERDLNKEDMDKFNSAAEALGQGDAKPMINFQKHLKATKQDPKLMDYVYEYWYNSILSGVPTHVVNVASNTAWSAWQVGVHKPLLAAIDPLVAKFQKRPTEYYMAEIIPALAGIKRGFKPGVKGAKEMLLKGYTTDADLDKFAADMGKSVGAFSRSPNKYLKAMAPFLTMPTRALRGMDIWAKQMNYEAELGSIAKRMEKKGEGKYKELLKNPTEGMMKEASQYADYTTFMEKLGKIGTMIESLRTAVPGGRFIMPFVRTIANLVKRGVEMTPGVGAMKLLGGKVKGKEVTQVLVKQIEGAMIALVVASMFDDDEITGDVPANKAEREAFYRQGKKPWSIKVGDTWYQYRRVEPFNTPIAAVGILYDTWKRTGEEPSTEFVYRSAAGLVNNIIDSSYLSGFTQVLDSVRKADKWPQKLTNMFDRTIASFSPMSSFQRSFVRAIEAIDKEGAVLRKPKGAVETLAAATPFISEMVPARKDVWGEEVVIEGSPLAQWLPWKAAKATEDVVEKEIERLHGLGLLAYPGMPAKHMTIAGEQYDFDDKQYDKLITDSGKAAKKKLDSLIGTSYWKMLSNKEKAARIERIRRAASKKAKSVIKRSLGMGTVPGMVPWKTKRRKRPAWQEPAFGKKSSWQKSAF